MITLVVWLSKRSLMLSLRKHERMRRQRKRIQKKSANL